MLTYDQLYHPPDVDEAHAAYGASCGPAALAAILRRSVMSLRPFLGDFEQRGYCNPTHIRETLAHLRQWQFRSACPDELPAYGLLFLQWTGPWCEPGKPVAAAYRHTHWVGTALTEKHGQMFYDINAWGDQDKRGDWVPHQWWEDEIRPVITSTIKRADGGYYVRTALEVAHA